MADIIDYKIYGDDLQLVEVELDPGEGVRAEAGRAGVAAAAARHFRNRRRSSMLAGA